MDRKHKLLSFKYITITERHESKTRNLSETLSINNGHFDKTQKPDLTIASHVNDEIHTQYDRLCRQTAISIQHLQHNTHFTSLETKPPSK